MIFVFFYILITVLSDPLIISNTACTCNTSSGFCDAPCKIESKKEEILLKCKNKKFHESSDLYEWLLQEIFCIYKNRTDSKSKKYNTNELENLIIKEQDEQTKESRIVRIDGQPVYIPSPFLATSECHFDKRPLEMFVPIDYMRCYYHLDNISYINDIINTSCTKNNRPFVISDRPYKSLHYFVKYENSDFVNLEVNYTTHEQDTEDNKYPLQVDVQFYNQTYDENIKKKKMKSGEAGYSHGQPLITIRWKETDEPEPFPVPFGINCSSNENISYTPLQFGYDTIGGCSKNYADNSPILEVLKRYTNISLMGQAQGHLERDWLPINSMEEIDNCSNLVLTINYEYVGNVYNPQSKIYSASYQCNSRNDQYFLFMVNFLRTSDEKSKKFIPKPKGLPDDTFAPII